MGTDHNDLTARMLTCATHLTTIEISHILTDDQMEAIIDARSLLIEAAAQLEKLPPQNLGDALGELLEESKPVEPGFRSHPLLGSPGSPPASPRSMYDAGVPDSGAAQWHDPMATLASKPLPNEIDKRCPDCGDPGPHKVNVKHRLLTCRACSRVFRVTRVR